MIQITTTVWSLTKSQTSWNVKSSGSLEASLWTKLVEVMEFQLSYFKSKRWCCESDAFSTVQLSHSDVSDSLWPHGLQHTRSQVSLSITNSQSLLKLMSIESMMPSNHVMLCHPLLLLPSVFPSRRVFSHESALHIRWPKDYSFSISSSNEYSELIFLRIDWFDLLAVQGTLKNLL